MQQYNLRAVTTLGYVAQLHPLPASTIKNDKSAAQRISHVLNNTFPVALYFQMEDISAPQPTSLQALSYAARYRAATTTLTTWQQKLVKLNKCRSELGPLDWLACGVCALTPLVGFTADCRPHFGSRKRSQQ